MSKINGIHVRGMDQLCSKKRERSQNYLKEEKDILLNIAEEYKTIIDNKKTDVWWATEKTKAWREIADKFNRCARTGIRTGEQLKQLYKGLKKKYKKHKPDENVDVYKTVGELSTSQFTQIDGRLINNLEQQLRPLDNIYDSNADAHAKDHGDTVGIGKVTGKLPPEELPNDEYNTNVESTVPSTSYSTSVPVQAPRSPSRVSPEVTKKMDDKTECTEKVKQRQIRSALETDSSYAAQLLFMKKERHAKKMEIWEILLKKAATELELKQLELQRRKENL